MVLLAVCSSQASDSIGLNENFLTVTPNLAGATVKDGQGKIPFTVKNNLTEDVLLSVDWYMAVRLSTLDTAGKVVSLEDFRNPHRIHISGPGAQPVVLKAATTGTYYASFSVDTMEFVASKNKKIFAEVPGRTVTTKQWFDVCTDPFTFPAKSGDK